MPNHYTLFESEQDFRYFRIFCKETAGQISGPFLTGLWNELMPQASEVVPFVRHAISKSDFRLQLLVFV